MSGPSPRPTADQRAFVERVGLQFEGMGMPRIGGRIFGLLLVAERPLSLGVIAEVLSVSRASVSTNLRLFVHLGFLEAVPAAGERRRCFAVTEHAWEQRLAGVLRDGAALRRLMEQGLAAVPDDAPARVRLELAAAFGAFLEEEATGMAERWRARCAAIVDARSSA
jgi:DNA-binding MarR family transcriptional regulator